MLMRVRRSAAASHAWLRRRDTRRASRTRLLPFLGFAALALVTPSVSHAGLLDILPRGGNGGGAPEIDPSALGSAIALIMGGTAMLTDRLRK